MPLAFRDRTTAGLGGTSLPLVVIVAVVVLVVVDVLKLAAVITCDNAARSACAQVQIPLPPIAPHYVAALQVRIVMLMLCAGTTAQSIAIKVSVDEAVSGRRDAFCGALL
jgi:hypothetical protein